MPLPRQPVVISRTITTGAALELELLLELLLEGSDDELLLLDSDELVSTLELDAGMELEDELTSEELETLDDTGVLELLAGAGLLLPPPPHATNPIDKKERKKSC